MRRYFDDRTNRRLAEEEVSTLKLSGPLRSMTGRPEIHLGKPEALALAKWLGFELARPDVGAVPGPEPVPADHPAP